MGWNVDWSLLEVDSSNVSRALAAGGHNLGGRQKRVDFIELDRVIQDTHTVLVIGLEDSLAILVILEASRVSQDSGDLVGQLNLVHLHVEMVVLDSRLVPSLQGIQASIQNRNQ